MSKENYVSYDLNWNPGMTGNMANDWPNRYCNESFGCHPHNYHGLVYEGYEPPNTYGRENCCGGGETLPRYQRSAKFREKATERYRASPKTLT